MLFEEYMYKIAHERIKNCFEINEDNIPSEYEYSSLNLCKFLNDSNSKHSS